LLYFGVMRNSDRADPVIGIVPDLQFLVELRGFEPLTPSMRTPGSEVIGGR